MIIENTGIQQGWQCPVCGRVYSPITPMCYYCGGEQKTITYTTNTENVENTGNVELAKTILQYFQEIGG
jgi:uncharacterized OB-fold protein